ncbi:putative serine protease K12H4.7 [Anopheles ziemanni]|uniref:putative serine protease K12H4.7 n=1 Tax=Anopheles coustani TaxID=139045 RepID=UPI002657D14A|nr:putative serine protease K12H4.7 [Anopheles coustani]XP_058173239.1 putative serine protease K12H4.7 [Anopheles ziemanni]
MKLPIVLLLAVVVVSVAVAKTVPKKSSLPLELVARMVGNFPQEPKAPEGYVRNPRTVEGRFTSRRNHFDPQDRNTFEFNYLTNDQYYREGGPLFVVVGGHRPINPYFMENSHFRDVAALQGAFLATNEHRYFGTSSPVEDYSAENLRFLRTEQVLFDLIEWIDFLKREVMNNPNARVILHGYGYGGAIASWARQRFPNIIDGAWVSSATVRATVNFNEFVEDVGNTIRIKGSTECHNAIFRAFHTAENLLDAGRSDIVSSMFNTCDDIDAENSLQVELFLHLMVLSLELSMFDDYDLENFERVCDQLTDDQYETPMEALAAFLKNRYVEIRDCFDLSFENFISILGETDINAPQNLEYGLRQLNYHVCTEFGYFQTAQSPYQPFGSKVGYDLFLQECAAVFGEWLTQDIIYEGVRLTNFHYGATDPRTTNVLFTNGGIDPFRRVSITYYQNLLANARVTPAAFFTEDIRSISGYDSAEMLETKHMAEEYISSWLGSQISPFRK